MPSTLPSFAVKCTRFLAFLNHDTVLRKAFLLLMAFWLPVQAGAALASSLTLDADMHPARQAAAPHDAHGHVPPQAADPDVVAAHHHDVHHGLTGAGCDHCGICQFVHGAVVPSAAPSLPAGPSSSVFRTLGDERFATHISDPLQRPPLSAA